MLREGYAVSEQLPILFRIFASDKTPAKILVEPPYTSEKIRTLLETSGVSLSKEPPDQFFLLENMLIVDGTLVVTIDTRKKSTAT